jgi:transcriptional regulator with XRE-family HTH domain
VAALVRALQPTRSSVRHDESRITEALSHQLRTLRRERGLSLDRLAAIAAVSRTMISQIENGVTTPTINIVARLAHAFGIDISSMLGEHGPTVIRESACIVQASDAAIVTALTPGDRTSGAKMFKVVLASHAAVSVVRTAADANLCITEGRVQVELEYETQLLEQGDALCFRLDRTRAFANPSGAPATLLLVTTTHGWPVEV